MVGGRELSLDCLVTDLLPGFDMLLGMDAVALMGGATIGANGDVEFANVVSSVAHVPASLRIEDDDFSANFTEGRWIVGWNWKSHIIRPE